jgi:hypothetical protein
MNWTYKRELWLTHCHSKKARENNQMIFDYLNKNTEQIG